LGEVPTPAQGPTLWRLRDIETIDAELQLLATLRGAAQLGSGSGPLPSIDVADALLVETP
jgi:hypothetical protein